MTIHGQIEIKSEKDEHKNMFQTSNFSTLARDINFNVDTTWISSNQPIKLTVQLNHERKSQDYSDKRIKTEY